MLRSLALAFDSGLAYSEALAVLGRVTPWPWRDRDCAWYGNLATCKTGTLELAFMESGSNDVGGTVAAGQGRRYAISAVLRGEGDWESVRAVLEGAFLPAVQARNICPTEIIDAG